jgi:hypothetical protein
MWLSSLAFRTLLSIGPRVCIPASRPKRPASQAPGPKEGHKLSAEVIEHVPTYGSCRPQLDNRRLTSRLGKGTEVQAGRHLVFETFGPGITRGLTEKALHKELK